MTDISKKRKQLRTPSESTIQAAFFDWLALYEKKHPELGLFYAIPNGANKSPAARGLFKRTGLKAGVPDVHLPISRYSKAEKTMLIGLWIEFKSKDGCISSIQWIWQGSLKQQGHRVEVCRSWTEAADITIDYLDLPIKKFNEQPSFVGSVTSTS